MHYTMPFWQQNKETKKETKLQIAYQSGFSRAHKVGNIGIITDFVFHNFCTFLLYLQHMML